MATPSAPTASYQWAEDATSVTLRTAGQVMPSLALGTWRSAKGEVGKAIEIAVDAGYRHLDCASNYLNEDEVGDTLATLFSSGKISRDEIWITSKLNNPYHHKEHVRPHLEKTLKDLRIDSLDLWLMHWPVAFVYVPYDPDMRGYPEGYDADNCTGVDLSANGGSKIDMTVSLRETWEAMEACVDAGLVKAIGLSNVNAQMVHDVLTYARIKPSVVQNESHPYCQQPKLVEYLQRQHIAFEAYSPIGTGGGFSASEPKLLQDPVLGAIAKAHSKSVAQICLRWAVQRHTIPLPKSVNDGRIRENNAIWDFKLSPEEMEQIAGLDRNHHFLRPGDWYSIPLFQP